MSSREDTRCAAKVTENRPRILLLEGLYGTDMCVRRSGGIAITRDPYHIKAVDNALAAGFDGLILTGGGDVDPRLYGQQPHKKVYGVSETRDLVEIVALERARELGVPVLGICRGAQLMAVEADGTLFPHLRRERGHHSPHLVLSEKGSRLRRTVGKAMMCKSYHHQSIRDAGPDFRVAALSRDGIVEAIESRDGRSLGVQFHPEMNFGTNEASRKIFRAFVLQAARVAKLPVPAVVAPAWWDDDEDELWTPRRVKAKEASRKTGSRKTGSRKAGDRTQPKRKRAPVVVSWLCPHCAIRFDNLEDREDHVHWIHGDPLIGGGSAAELFLGVEEPPPDHPDWELIGDRYLAREDSPLADREETA